MIPFPALRIGRADVPVTFGFIGESLGMVTARSTDLDSHGALYVL